jgi:hypothetical protein
MAMIHDPLDSFRFGFIVALTLPLIAVRFLLGVAVVWKEY